MKARDQHAAVLHECSVGPSRRALHGSGPLHCTSAPSCLRFRVASGECRSFCRNVCRLFRRCTAHRQNFEFVPRSRAEAVNSQSALSYSLQATSPTRRRSMRTSLGKSARRWQRGISPRVCNRVAPPTLDFSQSMLPTISEVTSLATLRLSPRSSSTIGALLLSRCTIASRGLTQALPAYWNQKFLMQHLDI